ncbi:hypothetical protein N9948_02175, partial [bacterium]|nr:hypothetical protein [bacterium]
KLVEDTTKPLPPRNVFVTTPYITGILDIRWDNPLERPENSKYSIMGVNIYKSEDSECGPFVKINNEPIQSLYYRDQTTNKLVTDEDALPTLRPGTNAARDWVVRARTIPIVKPNSQKELASSPYDVTVKIDNGDGNLVVVPAKNINGETGEIFLITNPIYNPETKKIEEPRLPHSPNGRIYISYWNSSKLIRSDLLPRYFYKVVTVGKDISGNIFETPLGNVLPSNVNQVEKPHYIWKGIIARNRYLLEQFGERIKIFIRKENGERCPNYSDTHKQAHNNCTLCFGTGFLGGYEGPIDATIAPPEAEKHIDLTDVGLRLNFTYESWMGPSPLIRTRDFVVRQNGERMVIGSVTPQGPKGAVFQQHFMLNYRDSKDIIYQMPIDGGQVSVPVSDDTRNVNQPVTDASPVIPAYKDNPRAKTDKGRTIDYENYFR